RQPGALTRHRSSPVQLGEPPLLDPIPPRLPARRLGRRRVLPPLRPGQTPLIPTPSRLLTDTGQRVAVSDHVEPGLHPVVAAGVQDLPVRAQGGGELLRGDGQRLVVESLVCHDGVLLHCSVGGWRPASAWNLGGPPQISEPSAPRGPAARPRRPGTALRAPTSPPRTGWRPSPPWPAQPAPGRHRRSAPPGTGSDSAAPARSRATPSAPPRTPSAAATAPVRTRGPAPPARPGGRRVPGSRSPAPRPGCPPARRPAAGGGRPRRGRCSGSPRCRPCPPGGRPRG